MCRFWNFRYMVSKDGQLQTILSYEFLKILFYQFKSSFFYSIQEILEDHYNESCRLFDKLAILCYAYVWFISILSKEN